MLKDIAAAKHRLALADRAEDLSAEHRSILKDIIASEISGTLSGCYGDIPVQVYHHHLCSGYSSTTIKRLVEFSYNHWHVSRAYSSNALRFGTAFHTYCNEPELFGLEYVVAPTKDRKSAEYRAAKAKATATNRILMTSDEFKTIEVMSKKLFDHPDCAPLVKGAKNELTFFSLDSQTGLWKKCRADGINGNRIYDLKTTTSAAPKAFQYDCKKYLYRISAAYYCGIISEVYNTRMQDFYLIPCEKEEPWECAAYRVADASIEAADAEINETLKVIRNILDEGEKAWKGYALGIKDLAI